MLKLIVLVYIIWLIMLPFLRNLEHLSDVNLVSSEGTEYPRHKVYLSRFSKVFHELFLSTAPPPNEKTRLKLDDLNSETLEALIKCINAVDGQYDAITLGNVKALTEAARKYEMPLLFKACDGFCSKNNGDGQVYLNSISIHDWMAFAFEYELPGFIKRCEAYVDSTSYLLNIVHSLIQPQAAPVEEVLKGRVATSILASVHAELTKYKEGRHHNSSESDSTDAMGFSLLI